MITVVFTATPSLYECLYEPSPRAREPPLVPVDLIPPGSRSVFSALAFLSDAGTDVVCNLQQDTTVFAYPEPLVPSPMSVAAEPSLGRNVHIYSSTSGREISGFWQHARISISTFYAWLDVVLAVRVLAPGYYVILHAGPCARALDSTSTYNTTHRDAGRRQHLHHRRATPTPRALAKRHTYTALRRLHRASSYTRHALLHCCITGERVPLSARTRGPDFVGFDAAHIFPLSHADRFRRHGLDHLNIDPAAQPPSTLDFVQNGFLCTAIWHARFIGYQIGIDPGNNYRIAEFYERGGSSPVDGRTFYINPSAPATERPTPGLLRDHFR
ncbi:hypothetical protein CERSUDRAFT_97144 [Gelatoporia subvermispora B]|uniref:HNH nuclease domain-containing protein n=1 Tax=Ceriporiopsis subvermispora (strain B) TaxID=914234 RepID=M2R7Z1_CERS8|nr:hypothetical protein CERSUDRAFT_97144 [Gelatoporia subvermispora B]